MAAFMSGVMRMASWGSMTRYWWRPGAGSACAPINVVELVGVIAVGSWRRACVGIQSMDYTSRPGGEYSPRAPGYAVRGLTDRKPVVFRGGWRRHGRVAAAPDLGIRAVEQGPILEAENKTIGVVDSGQGVLWYDGKITGFESHAGSTPMPLRRDALATLSEIVLAMESIASKHGPKAVRSVLNGARPAVSDRLITVDQMYVESPVVYSTGWTLGDRTADVHLPVYAPSLVFISGVPNAGCC